MNATIVPPYVKTLYRYKYRSDPQSLIPICFLNIHVYARFSMSPSPLTTRDNSASAPDTFITTNKT